MSKETGGPAFPIKEFPYSICDKQGMTLRDYFAAKAMHGFCVGGTLPDSLWLEAAAKKAYLVADVMLKAREQ